MNDFHPLLADLMAAFGEMQVLIDDKSTNIQKLDDAMESVIKQVLVLDSHHSKHLEELRHQFDQFDLDLRKLFDDFSVLYEKQIVEQLLADKITLTSIIRERQKLLVIQEQNLFKTRLQFPLKKILFAGCGPFPVSALLHSLANPGMSIDLLDMSETAVEYARSLLNKFSITEKISVLPPVKIEEFSDAQTYDLVLMASMIGYTPQKKTQIYSGVASIFPPQKFILTRYAHAESFASLLYSMFPFKELQNYYSVEADIRARPPLLSSQLLLKTK